MNFRHFVTNDLINVERFPITTFKNMVFAPHFPGTLDIRTFGRLAETFGAEYSADLAENFGRIFGFGRTLISSKDCLDLIYCNTK